MLNTHQPGVAASDRARRRRVALHLQAIEGNKLAPDQIAMFEMFDREGWSAEQRRDYILARAKGQLTAE